MPGQRRPSFQGVAAPAQTTWYRKFGGAGTARIFRDAFAMCISVFVIVVLVVVVVVVVVVLSVVSLSTRGGSKL